MPTFQGRHLSFFPGMGKILTEFLGGGAKYVEKKMVYATTQKSHYFSNTGGGNALLPSKNDDPATFSCAS